MCWCGGGVGGWLLVSVIGGCGGWGPWVVVRGGGGVGNEVVGGVRFKKCQEFATYFCRVTRQLVIFNA